MQELIRNDTFRVQADPAVNEMHACRFLSHYTGWGVDVTRSLRAVGEDRVNLCYTVQRAKVRTLYDVPGPGWGAIEAPLTIESLTAGVFNWRLFGEDTRMLQYASGGAGPSKHVGYSFGPVPQVKAECNTWFRRQYCGVMGFPGCIFSDARSGHWLAVMCSAQPAVAAEGLARARFSAELLPARNLLGGLDRAGSAAILEKLASAASNNDLADFAKARLAAGRTSP